MKDDLLSRFEKYGRSSSLCAILLLCERLIIHNINLQETKL